MDKSKKQLVTQTEKELEVYSKYMSKDLFIAFKVHITCRIKEAFDAGRIERDNEFRLTGE